MEMTFEKWPSIPRLSKEVMVLTEKIDGTNGCIIFLPSHLWTGGALPLTTVVGAAGDSYDVWVQSRTRFIYPDSDNFGLARWVNENAQALFDVLGVGKHYGEWWGSGIQRGYGLKEKRFSLFNAPRWMDGISAFSDSTSVKGLRTVPLIFHGKYDGAQLDKAIERLLEHGSFAAPEFTGKPEGVVMYLREAKASYKRLLENDDYHKWETQ